MDAFDADVLIYASLPGHPLGQRVRRLFLRAADAFHLATAVLAGADRFVTNNRRDFGPSITEIEIVYPDALDDV
jgi:predicted nucleic acid-binding protein